MIVLSVISAIAVRNSKVKELERVMQAFFIFRCWLGIILLDGAAGTSKGAH